MRKNWKKLIGILCCCGVLGMFPVTAYADVDNQTIQMVEANPEGESIKKSAVEGDEPEEDMDDDDSGAPQVFNRTRAAQEQAQAQQEAQAALAAARAEAKKQLENEAAKQAWMWAEEESSEARSKALAAAANVEKRQKVVEYALTFLGCPYRYGGNDPRTGVDCSGFVRYVLSNAAGVNISRTSASQAKEGVAISDVQMQAGDLLFYSKGGRINHVAMYIGGGKVIHASTVKTGVKISQWNYRTPVKIVNVLGD